MAYIATAAALLLLTLLLASIGLIIYKRKSSSLASSEDARSSTSEITDKVYPPICDEPLPHPTIYQHPIKLDNRSLPRSPQSTPPSPRTSYNQQHHGQVKHQQQVEHHSQQQHYSQESHLQYAKSNPNTRSSNSLVRGSTHPESRDNPPKQGCFLLNQEIYSEDEKMGFNSSFESYPSYKNWDEPGILLSIPDLTAASETPQRNIMGTTLLPNRTGISHFNNVNNNINANNYNNSTNSNNERNNNINFSSMKRSFSSIHPSNLHIPLCSPHTGPLPSSSSSTSLARQQPPFTLNIGPTPYHIFQPIGQSNEPYSLSNRGNNEINVSFDDEENDEDDYHQSGGRSMYQHQHQPQHHHYPHQAHLQHHHQQQQYHQQQHHHSHHRQQSRKKFKFNSLHASPVTKRSLSPHPLYRHPSFHSIETDI